MADIPSVKYRSPPLQYIFPVRFRPILLLVILLFLSAFIPHIAVAADSDGDGLGDYLDPFPYAKDGDGDGVFDNEDFAPTIVNYWIYMFLALVFGLIYVFLAHGRERIVLPLKEAEVKSLSYSRTRAFRPYEKVCHVCKTRRGVILRCTNCGKYYCRDCGKKVEDVCLVCSHPLDRVSNIETLVE